VSPHFARQVVVSGYQTPNLTFNTLSTREMSPVQHNNNKTQFRICLKEVKARKIIIRKECAIIWLDEREKN